MPGSSWTYTSSSRGGGSSSAGRSRYRPRHVSATVRSGISAKATRSPSLNGRLDSTWSSVPFGARSPVAVPAKTRRPDAKIASGASVIGSTTTSPRMPCALRTRPTMMNAGVVIASSSGLVGLDLGDRHGGRLELGGEACLVTLLQESGLPEERAHRVGRLRADVQPVVDAIGVEIERLFAGARLILADDLDELAVARALRVGDDDAIHGGLLTAHTAKTDLDGHGELLLKCRADTGLLATPASP